MELNGTHQLLAYADDVNILGGSVHTVKKNVGALVAASKETGLEVNAHKTKYMAVFRDQNGGRIYSVKMDNSSIERVEEFKYLGTTLRNQNSIQEEIKCREVRECLLLFGAESFVFQFAIQNFKDQDI